MQHQEDLEAQNNDVGLWIDDNPSRQHSASDWAVAAEETKAYSNPMNRAVDRFMRSPRSPV